MIKPPPICAGCALRVGSLRVPKCEAFDRIPEDILTSRVDHREAFGSDAGITFEPASPAATRYATWLLGPGKPTP